MERIATVTKDTDRHGSGKHGFEGNTDLSLDWFNAVQEELARIAEYSGASLVAGLFIQALQTLRLWLLCSFGPDLRTTKTSGLYGIASNDGQSNQNPVLIGVGESGYIFKITVDVFRTVSEPTAAGSFSGTFYAVACDISGTGTPTFVAVGSSGEIQSSAGGSSWSHRTADASYSGNFWAVAHNGSNLWVAVGQSGEIQTSPDGATWTHRSNDGSYSGYFRAVKYAGGIWVIAGDSGEIQTSTDGVTWTARTPAASYTGGFEMIDHDGSKFVLAGNKSSEVPVLHYSSDGITWSAGTLPSFGSHTSQSWYLSQVFYADGLWLCFLNYSSTDAKHWVGDAIFSFDGITWYRAKRTPFTNCIYHGCYAFGSLWVSSEGNGAVMKSCSAPIGRDPSV